MVNSICYSSVKEDLEKYSMLLVIMLCIRTSLLLDADAHVKVASPPGVHGVMLGR